MRSELYAICGCPRSGTTWFHNALIRADRFRGVLGEDSEPASRRLFVTDENQFVHALLLRIAVGGPGNQGVWAPVGLSTLRGMLTWRFGGPDGALLKSPYYSFFVDVMHAQGFAQKFIYIRRKIDSVAQSMIKHPFLASQINGRIETFSSMVLGSINFETRYVPGEIALEFSRGYSNLSTVERTLYKCLCFESSFVELRKALPAENQLTVNYEEIESSEEHRRKIADFLKLTARQGAKFFSMFKSPKIDDARDEPWRTPFCERIRATEAALWGGGAAGDGASSAQSRSSAVAGGSGVGRGVKIT